jgi:hypothetical protein
MAGDWKVSFEFASDISNGGPGKFHYTICEV